MAEQEERGGKQHGGMKQECSEELLQHKEDDLKQAKCGRSVCWIVNVRNPSNILEL